MAKIKMQLAQAVLFGIIFSQVTYCATLKTEMPSLRDNSLGIQAALDKYNLIVLLFESLPQLEIYPDAVLYYYNNLRELAGKRPAETIFDVDKEWIKQESYNNFKFFIQKYFAENELLTDLSQKQFLIDSIYDLLDNIRRNPSEIIAKENLINSLKLLKELLRIPDKSPPTISNKIIDNGILNQVISEWLSQIASSNESVDRALPEPAHQEIEQEEAQQNELLKVKESSYAQAALVKEAQKVANLQNLKIHPYALEKEHERLEGLAFNLNHKKRGLALCSNPDLDSRLFTIYHELGHLKHDDITIKIMLEADQITHENILNQSEFQEDTRYINKLIEIGKTALDKNSYIGKIIYEILERYPALVQPPTDEKQYQQWLVVLGQERRADLFALKNLFKQKKVSSILSQLDSYLEKVGKEAQTFNENNIVAGPEAIHPSDFERALYTIGFLADNLKNVNLSKLIQDWYNRGHCVSAERTYSAFVTRFPASPANIFNKNSNKTI